MALNFKDFNLCLFIFGKKSNAISVHHKLYFLSKMKTYKVNRLHQPYCQPNSARAGRYWCTGERGNPFSIIQRPLFGTCTSLIANREDVLFKIENDDLFVSHVILPMPALLWPSWAVSSSAALPPTYIHTPELSWKKLARRSPALVANKSQWRPAEGSVATLTQSGQDTWV